jgi:mannitol/fructose-specific phosphotransferase system IIA component (Ntr-type)
MINPALSAKTKPGVIRDMVALAVTTGLLYDDAALQRRERRTRSAGSHRVGGGAAFLHARFMTPTTPLIFVVLGKTVQHIFFGRRTAPRPTFSFDLLHRRRSASARLGSACMLGMATCCF